MEKEYTILVSVAIGIALQFFAIMAMNTIIVPSGKIKINIWAVMTIIFMVVDCLLLKALQLI